MTSDSASPSFTVSYDRTTQVVSLLVVCAIVFLIVTIRNVAMDCLSCFALGLAYAYSPRGYIVSQQSITVRRLAGAVIIPLEGAQEARVINPGELRGSIRLWGSGGLFGYYGWFWTSKLGRCVWYVTNRKTMVVVKTAAKTALFSPDDVDGFLASLHVVTPIREIPPGEPFGEEKRRSFAGVWIAASVASVGAAVGVFVISYAPGPPAYSLTPSALTIHDRFYPFTLTPDEVDVAAIRVVDIGSESDWRPVRRTKGFSNRYYRSGFFELAGGRTVRICQADGTRLVLLPPRGNGISVLLEVVEPDQFVQKVQQEWSGR